MMFEGYYDDYWNKRNSSEILPPIRPFIPKLLLKYTTYGAILNCIPNDSKILDIGCGDGNVSQLFLQKGEVFGIDISFEALKKAEERGIKSIHQNLNELPLKFENNTFDVITMTDVIEHLIDPLNLLKEAKRILKEGGKIILTTPNFARLKNRIRMLIGDPIDMLHWSKYGDEIEHLHWFTKPKLKNFIKEAGFEKINFRPTGLPFGFIYGLLSLHNLANMLTVEAYRKTKSSVSEANHKTKLLVNEVNRVKS